MPELHKGLILADLIYEEGFKRHVYEDHLGYATIGIGRCVDARKGGGLSYDEAEYLARNDIERIEKELNERMLWWQGESSNRRRALVLMAFQLGVDGLLGFKKMLWAMQHGDYKLAYKEALNSKWAKRDTPARAKRVALLILEG